ncbi:hypothetical protein AVEN_85820-1, partial [Araneus ventricosus]
MAHPLPKKAHPVIGVEVIQLHHSCNLRRSENPLTYPAASHPRTRGFVEGWILPKPDMKIIVPVDFPTYQVFYKIFVLPETTDSSEDLQFQFTISEKTRLNIQGNGASDNKKRKILSIDRHNGTLWLNRRVADMDFFK